ncbi:COCA1-like protein, partial [Mya arenaria]
VCGGFGHGFGSVSQVLIGKRHEYEMLSVERHDVTSAGHHSNMDRRKRQNIMISCCATDLCNKPALPSTTVKTTTAATPTTNPATTTDHVTSTHTFNGSTCNRDLMFVLDDSHSVTETNFRHALSFLSGLVQRVDIGPNQVPYEGGSTHTGETLETVRTRMFTANAGDRPQVPNVVLVITDGRSNTPAVTIQQADLLHTISHDVISVYVGSAAYMPELIAIATDSHHVLVVDDYIRLHALETQLLTSSVAHDLAPSHGYI